MMQINYKPHTDRLEKVHQQVAELLTRLPSGIFYHTIDHTIDPAKGVVAMTNFHALREEFSPTDRELAVVSAYCHDLGYLHQMTKNEPIGAQLAAEILPKCGYNSSEIAVVQVPILDTEVPTHPRNRLSEVVCDADVDNLGREDFFDLGELLRQEVGVKDQKAWYQGSIKFLEGHRYYTPSAQELRNEGKIRNLQKLYGLINNGGK